MSPRPRKVSDQQLFAAAQCAMSKIGPRELTLSAIAKEAGVTAAVLVQRFGSKRALLLALFEEAANGANQFMAALEKQHDSPLAALFAYADCTSAMAASPAALARSLAYLQVDLTDPDFRRHLVKQARATRAGLQRLVEAAAEAGELSRDVKPAQLARALETTLSGSLLTWAFYQEGAAAKWIHTDLEAILAPYLRQRRRTSSSARAEMNAS
jgi:AcrR family transcriptional regulator